MKKLKPVLVGILIGLVLGLWMGMNIGKGNPLFGNPFTKQEIKSTLKESGEKIIDKSGRALEETGKTMRDAVKKE